MSGVAKGSLVELSSVEEFDGLMASAEPVLVDFSAVWCGPCRMLTPILQEAAQKNTDFYFVKVDVDKHPTLASRFEVSSVPMVGLFRGGKMVDSFLGAQNAGFVKQFLDKQKS